LKNLTYVSFVSRRPRHQYFSIKDYFISTFSKWPLVAPYAAEGKKPQVKTVYTFFATSVDDIQKLKDVFTATVTVNGTGMVY
jgi:hypothetical protein